MEGNNEAAATTAVVPEPGSGLMIWAPQNVGRAGKMAGAASVRYSYCRRTGPRTVTKRCRRARAARSP